MLAKRKMKLGELALAVGISLPNLSILKTGKAKAIRFSTLEAICRVLDCQPADLLEFRADEPGVSDAEGSASVSTDDTSSPAASPSELSGS